MGWIVLIILGVLIWVWWDGLGAKEIAHGKARELCRSADVLFLDDSVALRRLRLCRHRKGHMGLYRRFCFEFTSDGEQRYQGSIDMLSSEILQTHMDVYRICYPYYN